MTHSQSPKQIEAKERLAQQIRSINYYSQVRQAASISRLSREDAEQYLDAADLIYKQAAFERAKMPKISTCLYCKDPATVSSFVEVAEQFFQLTCENHIQESAIVMWRKETL